MDPTIGFTYSRDSISFPTYMPRTAAKDLFHADGSL